MFEWHVGDEVPVLVGLGICLPSAFRSVVGQVSPGGRKVDGWGALGLPSLSSLVPSLVGADFD